jgi:hypothetical protein
LERMGKMRRLLALCAVTVLLLAVSPAGASVVYTLNPVNVTTGFNNSYGASDIQDCWVGVGYTAIAGGTLVDSVTFKNWSDLTGFSAQALIYTGSDQTNPQAGGGLTLLAAGPVTALASGGQIDNIIPVSATLAPGQVFFAAILIRDVPGNVYAFAEDTGQNSLRSFFDVGPNDGPGGNYNINNTSTATILGGVHPRIGGGVQAAGDLFLSVNATPEPATMSLLAIGGLAALIRRRK